MGKSPRFLKGKHLPEKLTGLGRSLEIPRFLKIGNTVHRLIHGGLSSGHVTFLGVENIPADDDCIIRSGSIPRILSLSFDHSKSAPKMYAWFPLRILTPQKWIYFSGPKNTPASYRFNPYIGGSNDFFDNFNSEMGPSESVGGSVRISDFFAGFWDFNKITPSTGGKISTTCGCAFSVLYGCFQE